MEWPGMEKPDQVRTVLPAEGAARVMIFILFPNFFKLGKNASLKKFPNDYIREKGGDAANSDNCPDIAELAKVEKACGGKRGGESKGPKKPGNKSSKIPQLAELGKRVEHAGPG